MSADSSTVTDTDMITGDGGGAGGISSGSSAAPNLAAAIISRGKVGKRILGREESEDHADWAQETRTDILHTKGGQSTWRFGHRRVAFWSTWVQVGRSGYPLFCRHPEKVGIFWSAPV